MNRLASKRSRDMVDAEKDEEARLVLDKGFVRLRNIAGPTRRAGHRWDADDVDPANVARMSFNAADEPDRDRGADLRLNNYLAGSGHSGPFEMVETWWEMKLPIFVARQFVRHRTASINEESGRYIKLSPDWYVPTLEAITCRPDNVKQGRGAPGEASPHKWGRLFRWALSASSWISYQLYGISIRAGIPPELARSFLGVNHYTQWVFKMDLRNLFHFLALREDGHAQHEAQEYARAMLSILEQYTPDLMETYRNNYSPTAPF